MKKQHEEEENLIFGGNEAIDRVRPKRIISQPPAYQRKHCIKMCKSKMKEPTKQAVQTTLAKYLK
jgi:hypothetical protein